MLKIGPTSMSRPELASRDCKASVFAVVGRTASPRRPLSRWELCSALICRSRWAARRSAPIEFAFDGGLVGRHLRGRRFLGGSSVPLCQPFSGGGSEIRPYRMRFCRGLGRAASPRPPLSRWELSSALPAVLSGRLGDPPLPNPLLPGVG